MLRSIKDPVVAENFKQYTDPPESPNSRVPSFNLAEQYLRHFVLKKDARITLSKTKRLKVAKTSFSRDLVKRRKFGFITHVDKGRITTVNDLDS